VLQDGSVGNLIHNQPGQRCQLGQALSQKAVQATTGLGGALALAKLG